MKEQTGLLVETLRELGLDPYAYSGRGMYGRKVVGVNTDDGLAFLVELGMRIAQNNEGDYFDVGSISTDSMGTGIVVYFTYHDWDESFDDEGDED